MMMVMIVVDTDGEVGYDNEIKRMKKVELIVVSFGSLVLLCSGLCLIWLIKRKRNIDWSHHVKYDN